MNSQFDDKLLTNEALDDELTNGLANILGEVLWHSVTLDASIIDVSQAHRAEVDNYVTHFLPEAKNTPIRFLEVAAYAHISGYLLSQQYGWDVTLTDISVQTLALGAQHANAEGLDAEKVRRVAADFHDLPFPDDAFDVVYIASALHHTLRWQVVLKELQRVTAPGGLLILQNEPCKRSFCFNKFPTNRKESFRPVETELQQQGIIRTIAEAYFGSRPEALFGMIENQTMRLPEMLALLRTEGTVEHLRLDPSACIAEFEQMLLAAPRHQQSLASTIEAQLMTRMETARGLLTTIDAAMGYCLPDQAEVAAMALDAAQQICNLPAPESENYEVATANLFGSALSVVMRKIGVSVPTSEPVLLRYANGERVGVNIGYPPALSRLLGLTHDLAPDIQLASPDELDACFSADEWMPRRNAIHRELLALIHVQPTGNIKLRNIPMVKGMLLALIRVYGHPVDGPFSIRLASNQVEYARVDVYQPDSFLLRGEVPMRDELNLSIQVCGLDSAPLAQIPPLTVAAIKVVLVCS